MDEDEQVKTVYAHFGLAMYWAQCVEQHLIQLIVFFKFFPDHVPSYSTKEQWESDFDAFNDFQSAKTMGQVIKTLIEFGAIDGEVAEKLRLALDKRNFLAHSFFPHHAMTFPNEQGRLAMVEELEGYTAFFQEVESIVTPITFSLCEKYGLTREALKETEEKLLAEARG